MKGSGAVGLKLSLPNPNSWYDIRLKVYNNSQEFSRLKPEKKSNIPAPHKK